MTSQQIDNIPRIGVEEESDDAPYEYTVERKVLIQPYDYAVRVLMDMIIEGDLQLDPDYQRQYRWDDEKASRFVESIALNIPVPVIYLAEESDGSFSVIDGQQRLTSLLRFLKPTELTSIFSGGGIEELVLSGLKIRSDMNGKKYMELERPDRSALAKRPIRCIVVLNESDSTLKFEVFERLNTGSTSLTDQEVRNCIYRGSYNKLLKKLALNARFKEMISLPENDKNKMKDVELVLRFFAYAALDDKTEYSGNYAEYLNNHMEANREVSPARSVELEALFTTTTDLIYEALGPSIAFRKPSDNHNPEAATYAQNLINGAIYESQMIAVSRMVAAGRILPKEELKRRLLVAFCNEEYWGCLFQGTSKKAKALKRNDELTSALLA